jgi:hypothetical protein
MSNYAPSHADLIPHEMIALRAYHLWKSRGCPLGDDQRDWYAARAELECELTVPGARRGAKRAA